MVRITHMVGDKKSILISGITGQDGSFLAELFLANGFEVHGLVRRTSNFNTDRIDKVLKSGIANLHLHYGDLTDAHSINSLVRKLKPFGIINMAAQSHVQISFEMPEYTFKCNTVGVMNFLEAIRVHSPETFFYQASTSELFGNEGSPQGLQTPFSPESPYAVSKLSAHELVRLWRESYGLKSYAGILFNHESFRRGSNFVTKKIIKNANRIHLQLKENGNKKSIEKLKLGNIFAKRDWGWAPEYMIGVFQYILNNPTDNLLIGTGISASVQDFCRRSFLNFNLNYEDWVTHDVKYERPVDVVDLRADVSSTQNILGWIPRFDWEKLCDLMSEEEMRGQEYPVEWNSLMAQRGVVILD